MTDSMGPGNMKNPSYTYDEYLICIGLGPSISPNICKNPSYSGPSYPSLPVTEFFHLHIIPMTLYKGVMPYFDKFIHVDG